MSTLGNINKAYVSALDSMLDTREINKLVTDVYNDGQLTDILDFADRKLPTTQPFYNTYINSSLFNLVTVDSVTSGNNSTQLIVVLTAATSGQIKVQDEIKLVDNTVGIVYAVSTTSGVDTVTIKSVSGADMSCTAADKLAVMSIAMGENADAPQNERFGVTRYFNKYQIFSITSKITDVQNASTVEITVDGSNKYVVKDHIEKTTKLKGQINAAFIGGDMSVTSFSDAAPFLTDQNIVSGGGGGGNVQTTRGVDKYIELYGISAAAAAYSTSTVALADIGAMLDFLTAARAPLQYLVVGGKKARRSCDNLLKNLGSSGVTSVRLVVDGKELNFEVDKVSYGGYELNFATMPILDHPTIFSQVIISKSLYWLPYNNRVKVLGGGYDPAMRTRYVPNQMKFGNELIGEAHDGALSPVNPVGTANNWTTVWNTVQGLECLGVQHFGRQRVLA
jgi:hypothetical protein